jgi:hypothetical protein
VLADGVAELTELLVAEPVEPLEPLEPFAAAVATPMAVASPTTPTTLMPVATFRAREAGWRRRGERRGAALAAGPGDGTSHDGGGEVGGRGGYWSICCLQPSDVDAEEATEHSRVWVKGQARVR